MRSVCVSPRFALFVSVALACIVGSENGQIKRPRASTPSFHSVQHFFRGFYQHQDSPKPLLSDDQVDAYLRDGYIVISGLLDAAEMDGLADAGEGLVHKQLEKTGGKLPPSNFQVHEFGLVLNDKRFRDVALRSKLPRAAAELMQLDEKTQNLRVLR